MPCKLSCNCYVKATLVEIMNVLALPHDMQTMIAQTGTPHAPCVGMVVENLMMQVCVKLYVDLGWVTGCICVCFV